MKLQYSLYIMMILFRNNTVLADENVYRVTDKVRSCSNWLSSLIDNLCNNVYKIVKRDTSLMMEKLAPKDLQDHMNKKRIQAAESWRRVRRQVASECCERACTVGTIILYCSDDAKLVKENPEIFE